MTAQTETHLPNSSPERDALRQLIFAARVASDAMCESLNLDLAVANDDFEGTQLLYDALEQLDTAISKAERLLNGLSCKP